MNDNPLRPEKDDEFFNIMLTRPSPLPPKGLGLGVLEICHIRAQKGELFPAAESYYCSLAWGISGQASLYLDGVRHIIRGGEFLLIEPGGELSAVADEDQSEFYYLLLDGPQAKTIARDVGLWNGVFPTIQPPTVWLERIAQGIDHLKNQENLATIGHALLVSAAHDAAKGAPDKMVWDACFYLQKNWNQPGMNVEMVLSHLNVCRSTLSPRFRKITSKTLLDYLMDIRYRNVLKMLQYDYETITTIASRCGFPDASWFSTWFRKRHGVSPSEIKRKVAS